MDTSIPSTRVRIGIPLDIGGPDEGRPVFEMPADYVRQIYRAGGLPICFGFNHDSAVQAEMLSLIDGLLIIGGGDINPEMYGEQPHEKTKMVNADRQKFDLAMLALAEARKMPTLGICLGCQLMNIHRGGSLHQHLPDARPDSPLLHSRPGERMNAHGIDVKPGTRLATLIGEGHIESNSRHHQGINRIGKGYIPTATATDGLVEGIEDPSLPFWMAVQWHPENLFETPHEGLFNAFLAAAKEYRTSKKH